jgi:CheY-like chemotaxis protein
MSSAPALEGSVLVVDDEEGARETVAEILRSGGYRVATAMNGEEAMRRLRAMPAPDLILLNLAMPVMNGWVFRAEQRQDPDLALIPVVLLSGAPNLEREADTLDAAGYLVKPIDVQLLIELVRHHCTARRGENDGHAPAS